MDSTGVDHYCFSFPWEKGKRLGLVIFMSQKSSLSSCSILLRSSDSFTGRILKCVPLHVRDELRYGLLGTPLASLSSAKALDAFHVGSRRLIEEGDRAVSRFLSFVHGSRVRRGRTKSLVPLIRTAGVGALAGGIAGGFTNVILHPIDTVKTKLQTRGAAKLYSGPIDVVSKVLASQGISGLYSGVQAAFLGSVMSSTIYFGTYELAKGVFSSLLNFPKTIVPPVAAAVGNIASSAVLVPKEVVKQRMQAGTTGCATEVFLSTIRSEGLSGLYAGYTAALLRNLPSNIISFTTFEYLKLAWLRRNDMSVLTPWQSVLSGALAGAVSAAITTPLDVVKTRLMTQAHLAAASSGMSGMKAESAAQAQAVAAYTYSGVSSTLHHIWMEEGARALLKGVVPRVFYSALFSALGFSVFETTRTYFLRKQLEQRNNPNRGSAESEEFTN